MGLRLNREIKAYCPDFVPVRRLLRDLEAVFIEAKDQVDFFYNLPVSRNIDGRRRLKLRVENGKRRLIYYCDRQEGDARTSRFQIWDIDDPQVEEALDAALGTRAIVRKHRELWHKENVIFNLDTVEGGGANSRGGGTGQGWAQYQLPNRGVPSPPGTFPRSLHKRI